MQLRARPSAPLSCPFSDLSWAAIDLTITGLLLFAVYHPFFERWPKVRQLSISVISGAFGGKGNCLAKGVLDVTFVSGEWSAFGRWQMWAFLFATILTCLRTCSSTVGRTTSFASPKGDSERETGTKAGGREGLSVNIA